MGKSNHTVLILFGFINLEFHEINGYCRWSKKGCLIVGQTGQDLNKAMNDLPDSLMRSIFCKAKSGSVPIFQAM